MAQLFQADSCSMTAQTKAGSSDCVAAALRASATSCGGEVICDDQGRLGKASCRCECKSRTKNRIKLEARSIVVTATVKFDEAHERRLVELNSLLAGDGVERRIDVRQMICGDVVYKRANDFVVAHAAVQPPQEKNELHADGNERRQDGRPGDGHVSSSWERQEVKEVKEVGEKRNRPRSFSDYFRNVLWGRCLRCPLEIVAMQMGGASPAPTCDH